MKRTVIVSALFAVLCLAQTASAFYAPDQQRWVNRDPIGEDESQPNLFAMVGNGPVGSIDPFGEEIFDPYHVNCLGFAMNIGYGVSPDPGQQSMKQLLEKYGWKCKGPTKRKCKAKKGEDVIVVYIYDTSGFPKGADPWKSPWPTKGWSDIHAIKKCEDGKWRYVPNDQCPVGTPGTVTPDPSNPNSYFKDHPAPKQRYCCTK